MELPAFGIHQELWHDAWVAATAAARSKKRQVDLDIRQRVEKLLSDYGPATERPLSLRVYGTMLKGFCVINNEKARVLHADCERFVIVFQQQVLSGEDAKGLKLPASKKPRLAALTLELDLDKVRESESFDWTQKPLEEGDLLRLPEEEAFESAPVGLGAELALLEKAAMGDEVFPAADAPAVGLADGPPEPLPALAAAEDAVMAAVPPPAEAASALLPFEPPVTAVVAAAEEPLQKRPRRLIQTKLWPIPGKFFGYDTRTTVLSDAEFAAWQADASCVQRARPALERLAAAVGAARTSDSLGNLRALLNPTSEDIRAALDSAAARASDDAAFALAFPRLIPGGNSAMSALPEVQALLSTSEENLSGVLSQPPEAVAGGGADGVPAGIFGSGTNMAAALAASRPDPFHPYSPEAPLKSIQCAAPELLEALQAKEGDTSPGEQESADAVCDESTARIGEVLRRSLESANTEEAEQAPTLDDFLPGEGTDRATAARTFAAVLVLATTSQLRVMQPMAYGPIALAWAGA